MRPLCVLLKAVGCLLLTPAALATSYFYTLQADTSFQQFASLNYPKHYPRNVDIYWTIYTNLTGKVIEIVFEDSDVESSAECSWDYILLYDGSSSDAKEISRLCGTLIPSKKSSGQFMYIWFHSDNTVTARGFRIRYSVSAESSLGFVPIVACLAAGVGSFAIIIFVVSFIVYSRQAAKRRASSSSSTLHLAALSDSPNSSQTNLTSLPVAPPSYQVLFPDYSCPPPAYSSLDFQAVATVPCQGTLLSRTRVKLDLTPQNLNPPPYDFQVLPVAVAWTREAASSSADDVSKPNNPVSGNTGQCPESVEGRVSFCLSDVEETS